MSLDKATDVVVIGAGVAGLAASMELERRGVRHVVIEAKAVPGGRAVCDDHSFGFPYDLGAFWLSDDGDNPLLDVARRQGFDTSDTQFPWPEMPMLLGESWETAAESEDRRRYNTAAFQAMAAIADGQRDLPLVAMVDAASRWYPILNSWVGMLHNRPMEVVSAIDQTRLRHGTYRQVKQGMGTLVHHWARSVQVLIDCPAEAIDWRGPDVVVRTKRGTINAKKVIITVSTGVLAAGELVFHPELPQRTREALAGLPMGNVNRIALQFDRDVFGDRCVPVFGRYLSPERYIYVMNRLVGQNVALGYVGSDLADALEAKPDEEAVELLVGALNVALGTDVGRHVKKSVCTRWRSDRWTRGAYAMALPGCANARRQLREPVGNRLFFAGEATSVHQFAHVHGAALEGVRAARDAMEVF